jgi:hypothetical protein
MADHLEGESRKRRWGLLVGNLFSYLVFLVTLAMNGSALFGYLVNPSKYPIGAEMSGLLYSTRGKFMSLTSAMIVLCVAGLTVPMFARNERVRTIVRVAAACSVVVFTAWLTLTVQ